jgi:ribose-phosphate pyrophosphokinase
MEKVTTKKLALYSGRTHPELATEIAEHLGIEVGHPNIVEFANGEIRARYAESVRGNDVFIIQSHYGVDGHSINDSIMEQLIMIDAAYRASAKRITAVCPFYGYARQDRKAEGREPITARLVADMFKAAGAKRMISIDLHAGQIQGFFDGPVDHLTAMPVLEAYLREHVTTPVIVSPDAGRIKVAERMAQHLDDCGADLAFVYKRRPKGMDNVAQAIEVIGAVKGRLCVITDDMIDTAGTVVAAADLLRAHGATEVWAMATHGVLSGPAIERLKNSSLERVVLTNTLPLPPDKQLPQIEVLSIAPLIAEALSAVFDDTASARSSAARTWRDVVPASAGSIVCRYGHGPARPNRSHHGECGVTPFARRRHRPRDPVRARDDAAGGRHRAS